MSRTTNSPLPVHRHFLVLDALRGVAAMSVTLYHACIIFGATQLLPKAFLAVDFFFLLSGVVVACAYESRLQQGEIVVYLERRAIRLYPMIMFGACIGMSVLLTSPAVRQMPSMTVIALGLSVVLCIPIIRGNIYPGSHSIAPVNTPSWSLFFELFVNVLYGFVAKYLTNSLLIVIVSGSLFVEGIGIAKFNGANVGAYAETFQWGFPRVLFPFFFGVLIKRAIVPRDSSPNRIKPTLLALVLVATLCLPSLGRWNGVSELVVIAVIYPSIVIAAMNTTVPSQQAALFTWIGAISYPLYAIHVPLFLWVARLQRQIAIRFPVTPYWWIAGALALSASAAWVAYRAYDAPFRAALMSMRRRYSSLRNVGGA